MKRYTIKRAAMAPALEAAWDSKEWKQADTMEITEFRAESSPHHPRTQARVLHSDAGVHGIFRVEDHYVRCVSTQFQDQVCKDSCVEFFFKPYPSPGYFNLECNCGGTALCYFITDASRGQKGFRQFVKLTPEDGQMIKVRGSMPKIVDPEIVGPTTWTLAFHLPYALLEKYAGPITRSAGTEWRGNFYKCADATSHPHWGTWSPVPEHNFHMPDAFGALVLAD
jgi:hypothetical protein